VDWNSHLWPLVWGTAGRLPTALLLAGPAGVGKAEFAAAVARGTLCMRPDAEYHACGACQSCRLFIADSHPDLRVIEAGLSEDEPAADQAPGSASARTISVDRIRDLREFTEMSSHLGGRKVVLINPAERLHPSAANALLKTLEEPPPATVFLLVCARPQLLLATLRSRCFRVEFRAPPQAAALTWLQEQGVSDPEVLLAYAANAPLAAVELAKSPFWGQRQGIARLLATPRTRAAELAQAVEGDHVAAFCTLLYKWCADLLSQRLAGRIRYNPDYAKPLAQLAVNLDVLKVQALMRELSGTLRFIEHPLNPRLVCERAALGYVRAVTGQEH
jgi:DNA polymerase-3 subunit delta'